MKRPHQPITFLLFIFLAVASFAQEKPFDELEGAAIHVYKTIDGFDLKLSVVYPEDYKKGKTYPAIVFFFGGGWRGGNVHQFEQHCHYLVSKGMIAMTANYRVESRNNSTPFDAVEDAKSAIRWIRQHAKVLGVKKNKLVAAGGSAGGHLAACTAIIPGFESGTEYQKISSKPNAMVLFNPVVNTSSARFKDRFGDQSVTISPVDFIVSKLPPTLIFHGTDDKTVPFETITDFQSKMETAGNTCYVVPFQGQDHGFFNFGRSENKYYELTIEKTESFLRELKYIK